MIRERGGRGEVVEETGEGNKGEREGEGEREIEDERKGEGEKRRRRRWWDSGLAEAWVGAGELCRRWHWRQRRLMRGRD